MGNKTTNHIFVRTRWERNSYASPAQDSKGLTVNFFLRKSKTSRERPKSAQYLRLNKTRKPLFLQTETTKALKKLIEEIFPNLFEVSGKLHIAEKCKGTLWDFLNIHSVAKYQKLMGGHFGAIKKFRKKNEKLEVSQCRKKGNGGPFCFGMVLYFMLEGLDALKMKY